MNIWLHDIILKVAAGVTALLAPIGMLVMQPRIIMVVPQGSAIISESVAPSPTTPNSTINPSPDTSSTEDMATSSLSSLELSKIKQGLLPKVKARPFKPGPKIVAQDAKPTPSPTPTPAPAPATPPKKISADWILENTTLSFKEKRGGPYEAVLNTDLGNKENIKWGLSDTVIGGSKSVPQFVVSFSCDPQQETPPPDENDQSPFFKVATDYICDVSLAPSVGNDKRPVSKRFIFKTDPGSLALWPSSIMDSVLKNDKNVGGFVFANRDIRPISVTGITFNASYVALNTADNPLIVRFIDSHTDQTLGEYHLEGLDKDPSYTQNYTQSKVGIQLPFLFELEPMSEKLLIVQVVGVRKLLISGVDPAVKIVIQGVTLDRSDVKTLMNSAQISWSCIVPTGAYDANATSGAFATGQACRD